MTTYFETPTPTPTAAKTTARPSVDYSTFVLAYARAQRNNLLLAFAGVALIVGAGIYTFGAALAILIALGLGIAAGGLGGFGVAAGAHASYCRNMATTTATTYTTPAAGPGLRAFVPSQNGAATIRAGRFQLPAATWAALFATADNGRLTRDKSMKVLPRALYRDWQSTLEELGRLGIVDGDGTITAAGLRWYDATIAPTLPATMPGRARIARTPDAPGAHEATQ